jgi:hypothetical protein
MLDGNQASRVYWNPSDSSRKEKNVKGVHLLLPGFISALIFLSIALPSYGMTPVETLADACQYARTPLDRASALTAVKPLRIRRGYKVNVFESTGRGHAVHNIAVILHNRSDSPVPEVPRIVAVCLDGKKDVTSVGGNISFKNEKKGRVNIIFRLVDFQQTRWVAPPDQALGMLETEAPNSSDLPTQGKVPSCLMPPPITNPNARDLEFTMCPNDASYAHFYVYAVYMAQSGHVIAIDPQIIHHPPN